MAKKDTNTLLMVGVVVVAWMWWRKNNGAGFIGGFRSGEMTGNPRPDGTSGKGYPLPSDSHQEIARRIEAGVYGL